ncbi:thioredoxin family protein [Streptococcus cuniculipharyngis]|uniref:Thioredoxin family protein n=1 Tax=Streptococcus cuniculipharyngis TaxID=1562651 RepID=A0A5C5SAU7_9STRE|nr:thioredoxin family protein [Streptococcus cuniculipharyngis]TWS96447.1 thioredoxin family protein [Streptococcus cuniculipharyngis]
MIVLKKQEELASYLASKERVVFLFTADWCPDCQVLYPVLPDLEAENPDFTFVQLNRDVFLDLAKAWDIFGIPSLVVREQDQEVARLVNKNRKTKAEINQFLASIR